jgi:hypothetical protein
MSKSCPRLFEARASAEQNQNESFMPSVFKRHLIVGALLWLVIVAAAWLHFAVIIGRDPLGFGTIYVIMLATTLTVSATACFGMPIVAVTITRARKLGVVRNAIVGTLPFAFSLPVLAWWLSKEDGYVWRIVFIVTAAGALGWIIRFWAAIDKINNET